MNLAVEGRLFFRKKPLDNSMTTKNRSISLIVSEATGVKTFFCRFIRKTVQSESESESVSPVGILRPA